MVLTLAGFFYVTGHGLETDYLKSLLKQGHQFFQLPQATKESIHIGKSMDRVRGWQKVSTTLSQGTVNGSSVQIGENVTYAKRDQQEVRTVQTENWHCYSPDLTGSGHRHLSGT